MSSPEPVPDRRLHFPFPEAPEPGSYIEVADGVLWFKLPLPFQLNHVNVYLIRDRDGWAILDTGIKTDETKAIWQHIFAGPLAGCRITKVIATHFHPDHIGLAGWLCAMKDAPLLTSLSSYMLCRVISIDPQAYDTEQICWFYVQHGMDEMSARLLNADGNDYLRLVEGLPPFYQRLAMGDCLDIGGRRFRVVTADGHAPEQVTLYSEEDNIFFAADQVLEKISPNISVSSDEPKGDPLGRYLRSQMAVREAIPADALVLPGHRLPFIGLHDRIDELSRHHQMRCQVILDACRTGPKTNTDIMALLFSRRLDLQQMTFAFAEALAHANYLVGQKLLVELNDGGRIRFALPEPAIGEHL